MSPTCLRGAWCHDEAMRYFGGLAAFAIALCGACSSTSASPDAAPASPNGGGEAGGTSAGGTSAGGTSAGGTNAGGTSAGGTGGAVIQDLMTTEQMTTALDVVNKFILEVNLGTLNGAPDEYTAALERARMEIKTPQTTDEFYITLSRVVATLHDAHSFVKFNEESSKNPDFLNLSFIWLDEGPVVSRDSEHLKKGDRILTMGGKTPEELMAALLEVVSHENIFHVRAWAPAVVPRPPFVQYLDLKNDDGTVTVVVDRAGQQVTADLKTNVTQPPIGPERNWVGYVTNDKLGLFWLDACTYDAEFVSNLDAFMAEVLEKNIENIVVDLKYNPGGNVTVAFAFLNFLKRDYKGVAVTQRTSPAMYTQIPAFGTEAYRELLKSQGIDPDSKVWVQTSDDVKQDANIFLPEVAEDDKYSGKLHAFTGNYTFSSANLFSLLIADNKTGLTIGQPTGNATIFNGSQLFAYIPHTPYVLSSSSGLNTRPNPTLGLESALYPDVPVALTWDDVADDELVCPKCDSMTVLESLIEVLDIQ